MLARSPFGDCGASYFSVDVDTAGTTRLQSVIYWFNIYSRVVGRRCAIAVIYLLLLVVCW